MNKIIILSGVLTAILIVGCKKNYVEEVSAQKQTFKKVTVLKPQVASDAPPITASGVLSSEKEINFSFKIGGIVDQLLVDKGDRVKKGQVIARLDLSEINAQVIQAKNGYDKAQRDFQRVKSLYADTVATLEQKQNAQTSLEIAKASYDIAIFNQKYSQIISPIEGKILDKMSEVGELVSPGQPIYSLGSTGNRGSQVIKLGIADRHVIHIQKGDTANITFDAFPNQLFPAAVTEISEEANAFTGTFDVELTLEGFHSYLKNGFVGYAEIFPSGGSQHYKIPMAALVEGDGKVAEVFVTKDQRTVASKSLEVNEIRGEYFTVLANQLDERDWIVMEGNAYISDRDTVKILNN